VYVVSVHRFAVAAKSPVLRRSRAWVRPVRIASLEQHRPNSFFEECAAGHKSAFLFYAGSIPVEPLVSAQNFLNIVRVRKSAYRSLSISQSTGIF
jgi:hypothetical protein